MTEVTRLKGPGLRRSRARRELGAAVRGLLQFVAMIAALALIVVVLGVVLAYVLSAGGA